MQKTILQFNGNYYHQLDGLEIGSSLAPEVADICINWLTNKVLEKIKNPPVIMRYVDDLFLALDNLNDVQSVYQKFKSIYPNLKFTKAEENDKKQPIFGYVNYQDVKRNRNDSIIKASIFRVIY